MPAETVASTDLDGSPRRHRALRIGDGPCLAFALALACSLAVPLSPVGAQAPVEDCLEETSLLPAMWQKLVDAFAAVGASVSSADERRRLTTLHVELGDLVAAKQGLSRQLGAFLAEPSDDAWAKVSARLPVVMDGIKEMSASLRKEGEVGSTLASEPVFKELRTILATRKADVLCNLRTPRPQAAQLPRLAQLKAKLDEEVVAMNAADDALTAVIRKVSTAKP